MKALPIILLCGNALLLCPEVSLSEISNGNLANATSPTAAVVELNLMHSSLTDTLNSIKNYYYQNGKTCPPTGYFLKQAKNGVNVIDSSGNNLCDAIGQFSQRASPDLKGKYVRIVVQVSGSDNHLDFDFQQAITDINNNPNGSEANFFQTPLNPYQWATTVQSSFFGNVPSASTSHALNDDYATITALTKIANPINNAGSTSSSRHTSTIN